MNEPSKKNNMRLQKLIKTLRCFFQFENMHVAKNKNYEDLGGHLNLKSPLKKWVHIKLEGQ